MDTRVLTFGEKAVGLAFNPGNNPEVDAIKKFYAEVIDRLEIRRQAMSHDKEVVRLCSVAITEAQGAQMWAIKAATWISESTDLKV